MQAHYSATNNYYYLPYSIIAMCNINFLTKQLRMLMEMMYVADGLRAISANVEMCVDAFQEVLLMEEM